MHDTQNTTLQTIADQETRQREIAHQLWEEDGRPEGKATEHWDRAGLIVMDLDAKSEQLPIWLQKSNSGDTIEPPQPEYDVSTALNNLRGRLIAKSAA